MKPFNECLVLIVDDVKTNINLLTAALKQEYKIGFALDGEHAIEFAVTQKPDVILLDIMMPGIDGYEVCRRLKANPATRDIPVLFVSGMDDIENKTLGFSIGAVDYITKPFRILEVKARIKTHLTLKLALEELKNSEKTFKYLASHDDLTGLYNTRHLYQELSRLLSGTIKNGRRLSAIFMDLDCFKSVVDAHGHLNGSNVIQEVGGIIKALLEPPAFGVAYGGDEFVVILPETGKRNALMKADQIRQVIASTTFLKDSGRDIHITASFGVATCPDDAVDMKALLGAADNALFEVKEKSKNAVHCAGGRMFEEE